MTFIWFGLRGRPVRILISVAASSAFLLFGYDQGVLGGLIGGSGFRNAMHDPSTNTVGTITAIYEIGCFFGAGGALFIGDKLGRRVSIIIGLVIILIGAGLQASAFSVAQMIVARIVTGIGNGINTSIVPVYQSETTKARSRGRLVSLEGWFITFGIVISYWITYGTASSENASVQFRLPIILQCVFAMITIILLLGLPETPRYLFKHDRSDRGSQVLATIDGLAEDDPEIFAQCAAIQMAIAEETEAGTSLWAALRTSGHHHTLRRLLLAMGLQMMQQLTGINAVIYYLSYILENVLQMERDLSLVVGGAIGMTYFVFAFLPIWFIDRAGRRMPLMIGASGMSVSFLLIAITVKLAQAGDKAAGYACLAFIISFLAFFGESGWIANPWLYPAEICELRFRNIGSALATMTDWIFNFMVVQITPLGTQNLGWRFFLIFFVFNLSFVPAIYFFYPETAAKTLEDLDFIFRDTVKAWKLTSKGTGNQEMILEMTKDQHSQVPHVLELERKPK